MDYNDKIKNENVPCVAEILNSIRQLIRDDQPNDLVSDNAKILELTDVAGETEYEDIKLFNKKKSDIEVNTLFERNQHKSNSSNISSIDLKEKCNIDRQHSVKNYDKNLYIVQNQESLTESMSIIQNLIDQVNSLQKQLDDRKDITKGENIDSTIVNLVKQYIKNWLEINLPKITSDLVERELKQLINNYDFKK